jgi:GTP pyrophosphokinase
VITRYEAAVDPVCSLIADQFNVLETVTHGVSSPETFGYASRHLLVQFDSRRTDLPEYASFDTLVAEVQVRSILQHAWALISHRLDYRTEVDVPVAVRRRLFRVAALLETGDEIFNTFVSGVETIRTEYRQEAAVDWGELALDMESAETVFEEFPWRRLTEVAEQEGYEATDAWTYRLPLDDMDRSALSRLIEKAVASGFSTWGQLRSVAESAEQFRPALREVVSNYPGPSLAPASVGPHILDDLVDPNRPEAVRLARQVAGVADE